MKDVILTRTIHVGDSEEPELTVIIGQPFRDDTGYSKCPYEIVGRRETGIRLAGGYDPLDALVTALGMIGADLEAWNVEHYDGRLRWAVGEPGDTGFPRIRDHWPFRV